jgi:hypothetical protein
VDGALDEVSSVEVCPAGGAVPVLEHEVGHGDVGSCGSVELDMRVPSAADGHRLPIFAHHRLNPVHPAEDLAGHDLAGLENLLCISHTRTLCPQGRDCQGGLDRIAGRAQDVCGGKERLVPGIESSLQKTATEALASPHGVRHKPHAEVIFASVDQG